jgi:hypothetical protein
MGIFDEVDKLCAVAGFIVLAHACYATISYRNDLKIEGTDFTVQRQTPNPNSSSADA